MTIAPGTIREGTACPNRLRCLHKVLLSWRDPADFIIFEATSGIPEGVMTIRSVQRRHKENRYSRQAIAADAIALTHFVFANIALILGETTELLAAIDIQHGGIRFIYDYLDAPVYRLLQGFVGDVRADGIYMLIAVELVIIASSILYGFISYLILRLIAAVFP